MDLQEKTTSEPPVERNKSFTPVTMQRRVREAIQDVAIGSLAGGAGKIVEYPFDTVKVRLQSQAAGSPLQYTGPLDCFKQSIAKDGLYHGLYRGISAPTIGAAIETSSLFLSYHLAQEALKVLFYNPAHPLPLSALCVAGAASGAFTSLVLTPIELVKCRIQVSTGGPTTRSSSISSVVASVLRERGLLGFWHGQLGTLIRETGGSAAWFGSYEGVTAFFKAQRVERQGNGIRDPLETPVPIWQQLLAGATAGMSYNFAFYPADTIKSRMQTELIASNGSHQRFWSIGRTLWTEHGVRGLYRGCGITVGRAAPSSAVIFTIYESLKSVFS